MGMLEDEKKKSTEMEIEALTFQQKCQAQNEIVELLEAENKKLEGQLKEVLELLENSKG
jgi:hypothetical protein